MAISSFGSMRRVTPGVTFGVAPGGFLSAGSLWFSVQALNRAGRNLLSEPVQLTWSAGQKIVITITPAAIATGEDIYELIFSASPTNTPPQMKRLCAWRTRQTLNFEGYSYPGQGAYKAMPHTIELTSDDQLAIAPTVATPAELPTSGLIYGMVRQINSTAKVVRYDDLATEGGYATAAGYWINDSLSDISTYLADTLDPQGCDRPLINVGNQLVYPPPSYSGDGGDSHPVVLWYSNGLIETPAPAEPQGMRLTLQFSANERNFNAVFSGRVLLRLLGYVRRSTGVLDTSIPGSGSAFVWVAGSSTIELPQDLPAGYAAAYELIFRFRLGEIQALPPGAVITTLLDAEGLLGVPDTAWDVVGDVVLQGGDNLRILPTLGGVRRLGGRCLVGGYRSPFVGETELLGLPASSPTIRIAISAALAGALTYRMPADNLYTTEAVRAVVSTAGGISKPSTPVEVTLSDNEVIQLTLRYPVAVRADYPDRISGAAAEFNVPQVNVYVLFAGQIYQLPGIAPTPPAQTLTIDSLADAQFIFTLPDNLDPNFCLFGYSAITATAASAAPATSDLLAGTYQIAIAYEFPFDNAAVTAISHKEIDGCIPEFIPLQEAIAQASRILAGSTVPMSSQGDTSDIYLESSGNLLRIHRKNSPDLWTLMATVSAPTGATGATGATGQGAFTTTTAEFNQPEISSEVTAEMASSIWLAVGAIVFIESGGWYEVTDLPSTASATLKNLGYASNAAAGMEIAASKRVVATGLQGGSNTPQFNSLLLSYSAAPTTPTETAGLFASDGDLKLRLPNNGATRTAALLDRLNTFTRTQASIISTLFSNGGALTVNGSTTNNFKVVVTEDTTISATNLIEGAIYSLLLYQAGTGNHLVYFNDSWTWEAGVTPDFAAAAGQVRRISALCLDGKLFPSMSNWYYSEPFGEAQPVAFWGFEEADTPFHDSLQGIQLNGTGGYSVVSGVNRQAIELSPGASLATSDPAIGSFADTAWKIEFTLNISAAPALGTSSNNKILESLGEWEIRLNSLGTDYLLQVYIYDNRGDFEFISSDPISLNNATQVTVEQSPRTLLAIAVNGSRKEDRNMRVNISPSSSPSFSVRSYSNSQITFWIDDLQISK